METKKIEITDKNVKAYEKFYNLRKGLAPCYNQKNRKSYMIFCTSMFLAVPVINFILFVLFNIPPTAQNIFFISLLAASENGLIVTVADKMTSKETLDDFYEENPDVDKNTNIEELEEALSQYKDLSRKNAIMAEKQKFEEKKEEHLKNYQNNFRDMTPTEKLAFLEQEKMFWEQERKLEMCASSELDIHKELGEKKI